MPRVGLTPAERDLLATLCEILLQAHEQGTQTIQKQLDQFTERDWKQVAFLAELLPDMQPPNHPIMKLNW